MTLDVTHLVYTNVSGRDGTGYRTLSAPAGRAGSEMKRVEAWLAETGGRRTSATGAGWAAASFRLGRQLFAAVARVPPGTRRDLHGRPGAMFVHAAFTPVAEGTEAGARLLALPLLEVLDSVTASPDDVQAFLAACEARVSWSGDPPDPAPVVQGLDRRRLAASHEAWRASLGGQPAPVVQGLDRRRLAEFLRDAPRGSVARPAPEDGAGEEAKWLARATAALPPPLRLSLRWSAGLSETGPNGTGSPAAVPPGAAERYRLWLEGVLDDDRRVHELAGLLHGWEIRSWAQLMKLVDPDPFGDTMTVPPPQERKAPEQEPVTPGYFQEQFDSVHRQVYDSLRTHFEDAREDEAESAKGVGPWLRRHRTELYFLITLLVLGVAWFNPRSRSTADETPATGRTPRVASTDTQKLVRSRLSDMLVDPDSGLHLYLLSNPTRAGLWVASVAQAVTRDSVHEADGGRLASLAGVVKTVNDSASLSLVRNAVFNYAIRSWELRDGDRMPPDTFPVNPMRQSFVPARMKEIGELLDLTDVMRTTPVNDSLKTAVVVRWMQTYSTEDTLFR